MATVLHALETRVSASEASDHGACPVPNPMIQTPTDPITGGYTVHELCIIIASCTSAFTMLSILILMYRHATHFSKPNEQLKILRISTLLPVTTTIMLIGILVPELYFYLHPWAEVMQALSIGNFFLLMLEFISPHDHERDAFFDDLKVPAWRSKKPPRDGQAWYRKMRFFVFQFWPVEVGIAIVTDITQIPSINLYCADHNKPQFAHIWLTVIHIVSTVSAIVACMRFCHVLSKKLKDHRPMAKLFAFKMLVGLNIVINIIFNIVEGLDSSPLEPDSTMSEADIVVGAHATLNCCIMVGFSIFFHYAYSVTPYFIDKQVGSESGCPQDQLYRGGFLGVHAWVGMLNPMEIISAAASIFKSVAPLRRKVVIEGTCDDRQLMCGGDTYEMNDQNRRDGDKLGIRRYLQ